MSEECVCWGESWNYFIFNENSFDNREWMQMKQKLGETKGKRKECLENLTQKLQEEKNLFPCLDEKFLLAFLRVAKFNVTKAYNRMLKYYRQQRDLQHQYQDIPASVIPKTEWFHHFFASPRRMEDGSIVVINKDCIMEPSKINIDEHFFLNILVCNQFMMHSPCQMAGVTLVIDVSGFNVRKLLLCTPKLLTTYVNVFTNTFPIRYQKIHLINLNSLFSFLLKLLIPLLTKKFRDRLVIHSYDEKYKSLQSAIPPEILPEWYGGHIKSSDMIDLTSNAKEMNEEFQKQLKFGYVKKKD